MEVEIGYKILVFLLTIVILIGFPIIIILSAPLILFRFIVAKLAPYFRPKLSKMLTTRACIFAADDYTNCPNSNIVHAIVLEGRVNLERGTESAEKRILEARFRNGDLKYPELKQFPTTWAGYLFWKDDKNFDIKNHIKIHQSQERFSEDDLQELNRNMLQEPWAKKRSMWDITFVPNYYPVGLRSAGPHTVLIIRLHHILGDGYSWLPLMVQELCQSEMKFPEPNYPKRSFCANAMDQITFPFRASYHFAAALSNGCRKDVPFRMKKGMPIGKYNIAVSDKISLKKMKEIRTHFNVCLSSVISAALTGAIRDLLISKRMKIPRFFPFASVQPLPGHSLKLRNYLTLIILEYPVGEDDALKRLKYCDANYKHVKESAQPQFFKYGLKLVGSHFSWMMKYIGQNHSVNSAVSNFPGPSTDSIHFNGHKWIDFMVFNGLQPGANGLGFLALSFVNSFRISSTAGTAILSAEEVNELSASIYKHIDILHQLIITDV